mgnify:CR=1 FL=1
MESDNIETPFPNVAISIVSHRQAQLLPALLADLAALTMEAKLTVFLTLNVPEVMPFDVCDFSFSLRIIRNASRKGFGANHNTAFALAISSGHIDYFCVVNPDIRIIASDFFSRMLENTRSFPNCGVVAPIVKNASLEIEDHARRLPTPLLLARKVFGFKEPSCSENPDWVAGMFMLFPKEVFARVNGFDEKFFLYYEDVDLCCRLRLAGYRIIVEPHAVVIHDARRASHRRPYYFYRHLASVTRFFLSRVYFKCRRIARVSLD